MSSDLEANLVANKNKEPVEAKEMGPNKKQKTGRPIPKYLIVTTMNRDYVDECDDLGVWQLKPEIPEMSDLYKAKVEKLFQTIQDTKAHKRVMMWDDDIAFSGNEELNLILETIAWRVSTNEPNLVPENLSHLSFVDGSVAFVQFME